MRLTRSRPSSRLGMNMTPMIDIVFLLIIFFMAVSQITQSLEHPIDLTDIGPGGKSLESVTITVNLDASGQLIVAGNVFTPDELIAAIQKEQQRGQMDSGQIKILIRCDKNCPGVFFNALTDRLSTAGFNRVRLSVQGNQAQ